MVGTAARGTEAAVGDSILERPCARRTHSSAFGERKNEAASVIDGERFAVHSESIEVNNQLCRLVSAARSWPRATQFNGTGRIN